MSPFRWLAAAVMTALIVPRIAQRGMFLDGVTYAVIARNMAEGAGSLWRPYFSDTVYPIFFEQPPLGLALQSVAFRLLGDHLFVERGFSIVMFALTAALILAIWRRSLPARYDSLPLFFWILPSVVTWAVINNMLENTQVVFTTLAVYCVLRAAGASARRHVVAGWVIAASLAVVVACLTKGPVGLFPLVSPILLLLGPAEGRPSRARAIGMSAAMAGICASAAALMLLFDGPRGALTGFAETHLAPALQGERGLPRRSSDIARHLTLGIWARMAALGALLWLVCGRRRPSGAAVPREALVFFAIGLSASVPVLVSPVLAGHYFVPSVPFFALAAAAITLPALQRPLPPEGPGPLRLVPLGIAATLVLLVGIVLVTHGPMERRDVRLLGGFDAVASSLPRNGVVHSCASAREDWGLHSYLQRFFRISLDASGGSDARWFLVREKACEAPADCRVAAGDTTLHLYRCAS